MKELLRITEDIDGGHIVRIYDQPNYDLADYAGLAADTIRTIADAFGAPVEMVLEIVQLRVKHEQKERVYLRHGSERPAQ